MKTRLKQLNYQMFMKTVHHQLIHLLLMYYIRSGKAHLFNNLDQKETRRFRRKV